MTHTIQRLTAYRKKLAEWLSHDGLSGGGGQYDRKKHCYAKEHEPKPETGEGDTPYDQKLFTQIRSQEVAKHIAKQNEKEAKAN